VKKYVIPIIFAALISTVSFSSMQAFGGVSDCSDTPPFDDNCLHASWSAEVQDLDDVTPASNWFADSSRFDLFVPSPSSPRGAPSEPIGGCISGSCSFALPNFVDDLTTKIIKVQIFYDSSDGSGPIFPSVNCNDSTGSSEVELINTIEEIGFTEWEFVCKPNPDWETINFVRSAALLQVTIWTASFGEPPQVGGELLPIDTTALMLAGIQSSAIWMLPVLAGAAGAGFAAFKLRRK